MSAKRRARARKRDDMRHCHKSGRAGITDHHANRCKRSFGKAKYKTRKHALTAASRARKTSGEEIAAYKCENMPGCCGEWHIGHADPSQGRFIKGTLPGIPSKRKDYYAQ